VGGGVADIGADDVLDVTVRRGQPANERRSWRRSWREPSWPAGAASEFHDAGQIRKVAHGWPVPELPLSRPRTPRGIE